MVAQALTKWIAASCYPKQVAEPPGSRGVDNLDSKRTMAGKSAIGRTVTRLLRADQHQGIAYETYQRLTGGP
jgi:hypothetical protein